MRYPHDKPSGGILTDAERDMARYDAKRRFLVVMSAYWGGEISEGMACKITNMSAVDLRSCIKEYKIVANELLRRYKEKGLTIDDDIREETRQALAEQHLRPRYDND